MPFPQDEVPTGSLPLNPAFLESVFQQATCGFALYDRELRLVRVNPALAAMIGQPPGALLGRRVSDFLPHVPQSLLDAYTAALQDGLPRTNFTFDINSPGGERRVRTIHAYPLRDEAGQIGGLAVIVEDVTSHERTQDDLHTREVQASHLHQLTSALSRAVTAADVKRVVLEQTRRATGARVATLVKVVGPEMLYQVGSVQGDEPAVLSWQRFTTDTPQPVTHVIATKELLFATRADLQREFPAFEAQLDSEVRAVAAIPLLAANHVLSGLTLHFESADIMTLDRQQFIQAMAEQCAQAIERARLYDAQRQAHERASLLLGLSEALAASLDVQGTLDRIASLTVEHVADWCAVYLPRGDFEAQSPEQQRLLPVVVAHHDPEQITLLHDLIHRFPSDPASPISNEHVLRQGTSLFLPVLPPAAIDAIPGKERRALIRSLGLHSMITVPLIARGRKLGVLGMATTSPERTLTSDDLALAEELARRAALALDNAQLYEAAKHSEERYRSLVDATRQAVWTTDAAGELRGAQPGWVQLTGQTPDEYQGYGWTAAIHPDDRAYTVQTWQAAITSRSPYEVLHRVRVADGTYRTFEARGVPVLNADDSIREWVGVHTDVTERQRLEAAQRELNAALEARVTQRTRELAESERRFRSIFDSQFQFIGLMQPDGTLIEANRTALDFAGLEPHDVIGKPFWEAYWWQTSAAVQQELRSMIQRAATGETVRYDVDVRGEDGATATIDFSIKPVLDEDGRVTLLIPEGRVISEERRAAALLHAVVSSAPLILYAVDREGRFLLHEGAGLQAIGLQQGAFTGQSMHELFHDAPEVRAPIERALNGESFSDRGSYAGRSFESWYQPIRDARGEVAGMIGVTVDVSDREAAEQQLGEALERVQALAALGDALQSQTTAEGVALAAMERLAPALHASAMLVVPVEGEQVRTPILWGEPPPLIRAVMTGPSLTLGQTMILKRVVTTRQAVYLQDYAAEAGAVTGAEGQACAVEPITDPAGTVMGCLVVWRDSREGPWLEGQRDLVRRAAQTIGLALERADATQRMRQQRDALRSANASLQRSNEELERFAYVASHDLQEPLRTIASFTELLDRRYGESLDESGRKYLALVTRGAQRLKVLIDDLLVFSRLNAVKEPARSVDVTQPLHEAVSRLGAAIEQAGAQVEFGPLPSVLADEGELTQLFQNLLGNAIKFRREGVTPHVQVQARAEGDEWHFTVRDNGIGIEPQYLERVFGLFQRLHLRDKYEGTGLGLAIVRKIVERHGGRVWAQSQPGEGSTFHFTLPAAPGVPA